MQHLTKPTSLATIILLAVILVVGVLLVSSSEVPNELYMIIWGLLSFIFGVQVPNEPMRKV